MVFRVAWTGKKRLALNEGKCAEEDPAWHACLLRASD